MSAARTDTIPKRASKRRRWARRVGLLVCLAAASLAVLYATRERWLAPILVREAARAVRAATGLELAVGGIGGNWWNHLVVTGVSLDGGTPTGELTSLSLARAELRFDLVQLLSGDLAGLEAVELDSARVALDVRGREDGPRPAPVPPRSPAGPFPWPAALPRIDARDLELVVTVGDGSELRLRGAELAREPRTRGEAPRWRVRAGELGFLDPHFGERGWPLEAVVDYRAGLFEAPRVDLGGREVGLGLELDLRDVNAGDTRFGGALDLFGGRQEFTGRVADGWLSIWLATRDLELGTLLRELAVPASLAGTVNLSGVWRAPLSDARRWQAHAWGRAEALTFEGRAFDLLDVAGTVDCERLDLRSGLLVRGANALEVADFGCSFTGAGLDGLVRSLTGTAKVQLFEPELFLGGAPAEVRRAAGRVRRAELALRCSPSGFALDSGVVESDVGGLTFERARFDFGPRDLPWWRGLALDVDAALSFEDLAPLAALFGQGDVQGALTGSVKLVGPMLRPSGTCSLAGERLSVFGHPVGRATVEARGNPSELELTQLELDGDSGTISARGHFDHATGELSRTEVHVSTPALQLLTGGAASAGLVELEAEVSGSWREPRVRAHARTFELASGASAVERLEVDIAYERGCAAVDSLTARAGGVEVAARGRACHSADGRAWKIALDSARLERDGLDLELEGPAEIALSPDAVSVSTLCASGSAGRASLDFRWTQAEQSGSLEASELVPMKLLRPFLPEGVEIDGVHGSLAFRRTATEFTGDASLRVDTLRPFPGSPPATLSVDGRLADRRLELRRIALSSPGHYDLSANGFLPTDPERGEWLSEGPVELTGTAALTDLASLPREVGELAQGWGGGGSATFRLSGTSSHVTGSVEAAIDVTAAPESSLLSRAGAGAIRFEARALLDDGLALERARISVSDRASADFSGKVGLRVDPRRWLAERRIPWREAPVELAAGVKAADLEFAAGLTPLLRRTAGALTADLQVRGALGAPEFSGAVALSGAEVRMANSLAPFERIEGRLELERNVVRIASFACEYGAAPLSATGSVEFGGPSPVFDLHFVGKGLLLAREEGVRLRADAKLALNGPIEALLLKGQVLVVEGRFSKDIMLVPMPGSGPVRPARELELPFLREPPWADIRFDVGVRSTKPIRVETNIARGTVDPRLELSGTGAAPRLSGTLAIGPGRVELPACTMEILSGALTFRGTSRLVPELDISATTRVRGFDITAQVGGTLAEPELLFTSTPPLASEELAVLVLTGQLPESALSSQGSGAAMQTVAVYLGRDIVARWLGVDEGTDPIADRFEFYHGTEVSNTGFESTEFIFRLTTNPKGKSRLVYLRAEQDVYERMNFGLKFLFRFQ